MENLINKLVLGTVQFGLDYGVNNFSGKPARQESLEMLNFAYKNGIRIFDTARTYGNAEEILGEFLQNHNLDKKIKIITKSKSDILAESLEESLKRLKSGCVDGYLFHNPAYIKNDALVNSLRELKKQGLAKNIGVSVYEKEDAVYAASMDDIDYIQIPYSIFDQRLDKTDFFGLAKKNNKKVFARSVFFQGLFLMPEEKIPASLKHIRPYLRKLDGIIDKYGLSRKEAALSFVLKNENIDYVVFGVDNIKQLKENIDIAKRNINWQECIKELKNEFINIEKNIIFPGSWKKQ